MKANWIKEFRKLSEQEQMIFASKVASFSISILAFLSLYDLYAFFNENPKYLNEFVETMGLVPSILFQLGVLTVFFVRFILLFLKNKKIFWINQLLWFIGILIFTSYYIYSKPFGDANFAIYSTYPEPLLKNASNIISVLGLGYLFVSVFLKLMTLAISIIKPK